MKVNYINVKRRKIEDEFNFIRGHRGGGSLSNSGQNKIYKFCKGGKNVS